MTEEWPVKVPDAVSECGNVKIETFEITEEDAKSANMRYFSRNDRVYAGTYKKLVIRNEVVMSNTHMERITNTEFVEQAKGNVLINGLGLGMVLEKLLEKHEKEGCIEHITVIEKNPIVIELVGSYYADNPMITIIEADALEYKPPVGMKYDAVWHDIWTFITSDNLEDMKKLHRKYGRRTKWQGSWARSECEYQKSRERNSYW